MDAVLGPPASGWEGGTRRMDLEGHVATGGDAIRAKRHLLLPALWAAQSREGWISPGALNYICQRLSVAPADAWGVATFYAMFSVAPAPKTIVHVCDDIACRLAGGPELLAELRQRLPDGAAKPSPCLGLCERAPGGARPDVGRRGEGLRGRAGGGGCPAGRTAPAERSPRSGLPFRAPDPGRPTREAAPARPSRDASTPEASRTTGRTADTPRSRRPSRSGPRASCARPSSRSSSAAAARPSRPAASGRPWRSSPRNRTTSSATPTSPSPAPSRTASSWRRIPSPSSRR